MKNITFWIVEMFLNNRTLPAPHRCMTSGSISIMHPFINIRALYPVVLVCWRLSSAHRANVVTCDETWPFQ